MPVRPPTGTTHGTWMGQSEPPPYLTILVLSLRGRQKSKVNDGERDGGKTGKKKERKNKTKKNKNCRGNKPLGWKSTPDGYLNTGLGGRYIRLTCQLYLVIFCSQAPGLRVKFFAIESAVLREYLRHEQLILIILIFFLLCAENPGILGGLS